MIKGSIALLLTLLSLCGAASAAPEPGTQVTVGYLELSGDPRYQEKDGPAETSIVPARPLAGAVMGISEINLVGAAQHRVFRLEEIKAEDAAGLIGRLPALSASGIHWLLMDVPDKAAASIARAAKDRDVLLINVSAVGDDLRQAGCQKNLMHTMPSRAMLTDALGQFLVARKWRNVLVLRGPLPQDKAMVADFERSARRFGLNIVAARDFLLSNDPRRRDSDNLALLTQGSYDVVFIADADGEFSRHLPYATILPRPVVGSAGLRAMAWDWAWERYGGPQISHRFKRAAGRPMDGADWAAWIAVRALGRAVERAGTTAPAKVDAYLLGASLELDGAKGPPVSFRSWNHQLRQPIFLATSDNVVAAAPMPGFLHETNNLDTLGYDKPETACHF